MPLSQAALEVEWEAERGRLALLPVGSLRRNRLIMVNWPSAFSIGTHCARSDCFDDPPRSPSSSRSVGPPRRAVRPGGSADHEAAIVSLSPLYEAHCLLLPACGDKRHSDRTPREFAAADGQAKARAGFVCEWNVNKPPP